MTYAFLPMSDVSQLIVSQILKEIALFRTMYWMSVELLLTFFIYSEVTLVFVIKIYRQLFCMTLGLIINCNTFMSTVHCSYSCNGSRASWSLKLWKICWRCCNGQFLYDDITFTFFFQFWAEMWNAREKLLMHT